MKSKVIIILFLAFALSVAFYITTHGQTYKSTKEFTKCGTVHQRTDTTFLIADETFLNYTKTEAKITCTNESVFNEIFKSHGTLFKRFSCTWKSDRHGRYKYYVIYLNKDDADILLQWIKTNL